MTTTLWNTTFHASHTSHACGETETLTYRRRLGWFSFPIANVIYNQCYRYYEVRDLDQNGGTHFISDWLEVNFCLPLLLDRTPALNPSSITARQNPTVETDLRQEISAYTIIHEWLVSGLQFLQK